MRSRGGRELKAIRAQFGLCAGGRVESPVGTVRHPIRGGALLTRPQAVAVPYPSRMAWLARLPKWTCSFAFQPIVNARTQEVTAYEALVRGPQNESADAILNSIKPADLATFDEECRKAALGIARRLDIHCDLNLNLLPQGFRAD